MNESYEWVDSNGLVHSVSPSGGTTVTIAATTNTQFPTADSGYAGVYYGDEKRQFLVEELEMQASPLEGLKPAQQAIVDAVLSEIKPQLDAIEEALRLLVES